MEQGTVKFFNETKGFGFITYNGKDIFFHISELKNSETIDQGDSVEFTIGDGKNGKGPCAMDINIVR